MPSGAARARAAASPWHALAAHDAVAALASDAASGLSDQEASKRLGRFGPNQLPEPVQRSGLAVFLHQFQSPLIYLLFGAAGISLALGHRSDAAVIAVVVFVNAGIGAFQEGRAERSLAALRRHATHTARVLRSGRERLAPARELVPGDLLILEAGDAVPADARLLDGAALQLSEAALTGESVPAEKALRPLAPDTPLADRANMIFAGTHVAAGRARALVVATGLGTEIGRIAALAESAPQPQTPLERRVARFGRAVLVAALALFGAILAIGLARGMAPGQILMLGISQLVGMIPEGLPVAMTIGLSVGVQRMAKRRAIVRRLAAVETLGSTSVICSDKTGTLTRNEMTAVAVWLPARALEISGAGFEPVGSFREGDSEVDPARDPDLQALLEAALLCNDSQLLAPTPQTPSWLPLGDPTEVALIALALKGGLLPDALRARWPRRAELPFDASTRMMATQHAGPAPLVFVKGAPEAVLALCREQQRAGASAPLDETGREAVRSAAEALAGRALRVLALAVVEGVEIDAQRGFEALRGRAKLLGLVGEFDPPRPQVPDAIARCQSAGIRPVLVTGDHATTGLAVARLVGIASESDGVLEGSELERLSDAELAQRIEGVRVFARVHPAQKLRLVEAYQRQGHVVAMTGDGVNDAPALVRADVGVAMGQSGTDVARDAAEIVLADDDFATIVAAVEEGRVVYQNLQKAILLLFSTAAAEVSVLLLALLLGYPPPFLAVQILWNNLVTEGVITVNLVMEPAEGDEMRRRPLSAREPLLPRDALFRLLGMTLAIAATTLGWFAARSAAGVPEAQLRTETFTLLAVCEWFNVLNCRSALRSALSLEIFRNRWLVAGIALANALQLAVVFWRPLGEFFYTVPLDLALCAELGVAGSAVLWLEEARKLWARRRLSAQAGAIAAGTASEAT